MNKRDNEHREIGQHHANRPREKEYASLQKDRFYFNVLNVQIPISLDRALVSRY